MKLVLDVREACRQNRTGKGQWTFGFVSELLRREHELLLLTDEGIPVEWQQYYPVTHTLHSGIRWHRQTASLLKKKKEIDFYITPTSYIVPFIVGSSVPFLPVVHDLIAFQNEPHDRKAKMIERLTLKRALKNAKHIFSVSESTKQDILGRYSFVKPEDVSVIYAGPMETSPPQNKPDHRTILCAATLSPRKNQLRLIQAYTSLPNNLRSQYRLLLAGGRGWHDQEIIDLAEQTEGVEWKGFVSTEEYGALLSSCEVLALPSLYEGFGMQVLDALQRGIPVLTSNRGSLPEVTGECAVLVEPEDVQSIADGLERILTSKSFQEDLRTSGPPQAKNFSWKGTADHFLTILKQLQ